MTANNDPVMMIESKYPDIGASALSSGRDPDLNNDSISKDSII